MSAPPSPEFEDVDDLVLAAARYHLLTRVLPAQRHDAMGRLSVLRMALMVMRRRPVAAPGSDTALADGGIDKLDDYLKDATTDLKRLRWWDRPTGQREAADQILADAARLVAALLTLRGHSLDVDPADEALRGLVAPAPDTVLALIATALQASDAAEGRWRWHWQARADGVHAKAEPVPQRDGQAEGNLPIIGDRLLPWMADALVRAAGAALDRQADGWTLRWSTQPAPRAPGHA